MLYRDPVDAIMSMNNRGLPKIWRRAGRTFKLHKQVDLFLSQLDEMHGQLQSLRTEEYVVLNYTDLLVRAQGLTPTLPPTLTPTLTLTLTRTRTRTPPQPYPEPEPYV